MLRSAALLILFAAAAWPAAAEVRCAEIFTDRVLVRFADTAAGWEADHILITSEEHYPLSVVLKNLGLDALPTRGTILSVGEGMSPLVPEINRNGGRAKGLDIWYEQPDLPAELANYVRANSQSLMVGSATKIPLGDKSVDLVLSHALVNNLPGEAIEKAIFEMLRVARREVRVGGCCWLPDSIVKKVRARYGSKIDINVERSKTSWDAPRFGRIIEIENALVVMKWKIPPRAPLAELERAREHRRDRGR